MSLLPSCPVISFISFARTSVRPLVCIRAPVHQISIRWPRFLTRRCPCALDFPPITITYLGLVRSSFHVFSVCPSWAHMCTFISFLLAFRPLPLTPRSGPWIHRGPFGLISRWPSLCVHLRLPVRTDRKNYARCGLLLAFSLLWPAVQPAQESKSDLNLPLR